MTSKVAGHVVMCTAKDSVAAVKAVVETLHLNVFLLWRPHVLQFAQTAKRLLIATELTMGHGSKGSRKLDGSYWSWVTWVDPLTHTYFLFFTVTVM